MQNNSNLPTGTEVAVRLYNCKSGDMISVQVMKPAANQLKNGRYSFSFKDGRMYFNPDSNGLRFVTGTITTMNAGLVKNMLHNNATGFYLLDQDPKTKKFYIDLNRKLTPASEGQLKEPTQPVDEPINETAKSDAVVSQPAVVELPAKQIDAPAEKSNDAYATAKEIFYKKLIKAVKEGNLEKAKLVVELFEEFEEAI